MGIITQNFRLTDTPFLSLKNTWIILTIGNIIFGSASLCVHPNLCLFYLLFLVNDPILQLVSLIRPENRHILFYSPIPTDLPINHAINHEVSNL